MSEIEFYYNRPIDTALIQDTFKKSFHKDLDCDYWNWRFLNNPVNDKIFINYIEENNILASYYAVSPCIIEKDGEEIGKIALSNMTMTHPDFQGKGHFQKLSTAMFSELKNAGYSGVYGFANQNSHYGFRKYMGWHDLSHLNIFKTDFSSFRIKNIKTDNAFSFEFTEIDQTIINVLSSLKFNTNKINISRRTDLLKWRILDIPTYKYHSLLIYNSGKIVGSLIYKFYDNNADIMEFFYLSEFEKIRYEILGMGISEIISKYKKAVCIWSNIHSEEHLYLEKIGFCESNFITYFGVIPFTDNQEILDYRNWHYRFLDSDVF